MSGWWRGSVPLRLRVFFRGAFLLLTLAIVALALFGLREEKQLSYRAYRDLFDRSSRQIDTRLQHPSGQLALLNPAPAGMPAGAGASAIPMHPLLLPYSAIDFADGSKAQQTAEMAGCLMQYPDGAQLCVAVGNRASAGGFVYLIGSFAAGELGIHTRGNRNLTGAHRLSIDISEPGGYERWIAPLEPDDRLTGFRMDASDMPARRPDREFRGWLWQDRRCLPLPTDSASNSGCRRRTYFSVRVPVSDLAAAVASADADRSTRAWPPLELSRITVHIRALGPDATQPLFDSAAGATAPFALADLKAQLLPGESLTIRRLLPDRSREVAALLPDAAPTTTTAYPLRELVSRLPVPDDDTILANRQLITTPVGVFEVFLEGDPHSTDLALYPLARRLALFVAAILVAIALTWAAIELRIIRRVTLLTRRAAAFELASGSPRALQLDLNGLTGGDEVGLLAGVLSDLLRRINDDTRREQLRVEQEKTLWHAVGHEIMSPLQSLAALHANTQDPSVRYIERMRQAVRVLYGSASPSDAFLCASLRVQTLDADAFLRMIADNAADAGIAAVQFESRRQPVIVRAEEYALEDVVTHVLSNADRHRVAGTSIRMALTIVGQITELRIHNQGPQIAPDRLQKVFDYGVSEAAGRGGQHRGQGLFVARTYMAKMGGTIDAENVDDGVEFVLRLAAA
ncbi:MAG TPA: ATP-binding protein [Steroidobacteraceae bacterium]|jgi:signal transduction histidine kinase|nr:ATP-binding protein [Steroidobacteraceae bacterium]